MTWKAGTSARADFGYKVGASGHRTNLAETVNAVSRTFAWQCDPMYRLTNESVSGASPTGGVGYGLDGVGNRTNRNSTLSGVANQTLTYGANDWLNSDSYDNNGSTTASGGNSYQYDVENRLTNLNSGAVVIVYNGDGVRVRKTVGGVTTFYLVADLNPTGYGQVLEEFTVTGTTNVNRRYGIGLDLVSQSRLVGSSWVSDFYGYDGHGSVRFLTDTNGAVTDSYAYDAFGTVITSSGSTPNNYKYCGEQFDADLGFYYLRARYLNPESGRFSTRDEWEGILQNPPSLHKYLYCHADAVNAIDPSGMLSMAEALQRIGISGQMAARIAPQVGRGISFIRNTCHTLAKVYRATEKIEGIYMIIGIAGETYVGSSVNITTRLASHKAAGGAVGDLLAQKGTQVIKVAVNIPGEVGKQDVGRFLRVIEQKFLDEITEFEGPGSGKNLNKIRARTMEKFEKAVKNACKKVP